MSRAAVLPHTPEDALVERERERDVERGALLPYDEQAWQTGETLRSRGDFTEEDYIPAVVARERLQTVVSEMEGMRRAHHSMLVEVRKNYEVIGEETKGYYAQYIADLTDRYHRHLKGLQRETERAKEAVLPLRDELAARELQVEELRQEVEAAREGVQQSLPRQALAEDVEEEGYLNSGRDTRGVPLGNTQRETLAGDRPRVQELEESMAKVEAELQEKNAQIAELCKRLRSGEEAAALEHQRDAEAAAIEAGDTQAAAAARAEREALEAKARESEAAAAAAAARAVAARAKPAERAVYKVNLALLRARLNRQLQQAEAATHVVESTQQRLAAEQRVKAERVICAQADLAEAQQLAAAVRAGSDVEGAIGSAEAMTNVAEAQEQLAAAQVEVAGLRAHEVDLERQREKLEKEKSDLEAALAQQTEVASQSEHALKLEVARLEAAGKASIESLQKQSELSAGVVERLNVDLAAAQTELTVAQAVVQRPPAGRRPSEKKADREKVAAIKAKIESLGLSIQQLSDGAARMEKAAEEPEPEQASAEAADLMAHTAADIARIGELEAQVANLQSANAALLETPGEGTVAEAAVRAGGGEVLAAKLARAEARAAAAEKALDDAKLTGDAINAGNASGGGASRGMVSAADAKKAKAAEAKMKQLEAKVAKLTDALQTEKDKAAAAAAGAKEGAAAEREKKKLAADAEKKLQAAHAETEKAAKLADQKAKEAAQLAEKLEAAEAELAKLQKQGAGASKELESLREQAEQLAIVQAHEAELDERLKSQASEMRQLETEYSKQVTLRKKYYNMVEDMKGKIRVYARCRPMAKYPPRTRTFHICMRK